MRAALRVSRMRYIACGDWALTVAGLYHLRLAAFHLKGDGFTQSFVLNDSQVSVISYKSRDWQLPPPLSFTRPSLILTQTMNFSNMAFVMAFALAQWAILSPGIRAQLTNADCVPEYSWVPPLRLISRKWRVADCISCSAADAQQQRTNSLPGLRLPGSSVLGCSG